MMFANRSGWLAGLPQYIPGEPLVGDIKVDVAIVGAGITGMSSAYNVRKLSQGARVALLEGGEVGYGASSRSSGMVMTQIGLDEFMIQMFYGKERSIELHQYGVRAFNYIRDLIHEHDMKSDYRDIGLIRTAVGKQWDKGLKKYQEYYESIGEGAIVHYLDREQMAEEVRSPYFYAGLYEERMGWLQPAKHVRELKRICQEVGVEIYEQTPVIRIDRTGDKICLSTPSGNVYADRIILATNGFSHLLNGLEDTKLKKDGLPVFVYGLNTEKLTDEQWESLGWTNGRCILTNFELFHGFVPTSDGRLHVSFDTFIGIPKGNAMDREFDLRNREICQRHLGLFFPGLKELKFEYSWGGPISGTADLIPHTGWLDKEQRIAYSLGCWGHGVALGHLNGLTLAQLVCGIQSDLTDTWFIKRKKRHSPFPGTTRKIVEMVFSIIRRTENKKVKKAGLPFSYSVK